MGASGAALAVTVCYADRGWAGFLPTMVEPS
jgi:hypothetical protein